jgi:hypothetical protein
MAYFTVRNSLNPHKAIVCGITYKQVIDKNSYDGELIWVMEVATDEPHITTSGTIPPYFINITNESDLDLEIEKAISYISQQVNWEPLVADTRPPFVTSVQPDTYIQKMHENVIVTITDLHPSEGIDLNSIEMTVNGIDVTDDLRIGGDEYEYIVEWRPPARVYTQLEE